MTVKRLYYDDSFLCEFAATVVRCEVAGGVDGQSWSVVLDETAFYPTSGGQPHDTGLLGKARVLEVADAEAPADEVIHRVDRPLALGRVAGKIDWVRRFDHMQQHTGQHLLSGIFQTRFGLPTVSFHLGSELSTIDLQGPEPSEKVLADAECAANAGIFEDRPVNVLYGTAEELAQRGIRKKVERAGVLRAIEIEGLDLQPCGGTHLARTGQIGLLLVRRCSRIRQDWRVEFVCGERARRTARSDFGMLKSAAAQLTCSPEELTASVERLQVERDAHFRTVRALSERLAVAEAQVLSQAAESGAEGLRVVARVFDEAEGEFLRRMATETAKTEKMIGLFASRSSGQIVFAQHAAAGREMNQLVRETLQEFGGKGGGARDFARGRLADAKRCEEAVAWAKQRVWK